MENIERYERAVDDILAELRSARSKHGEMHSAHEGYAILLEEVDELWDEVKKRDPDYIMMRREAIQVAAVALAFAAEIGERSVRR